MFDMCKERRCEIGKEYINRVQPSSAPLDIIAGDTRETVARFADENPDLKCQWLSVDAGHIEDMPILDLRNIQRFADCDFNILVMDDVGPPDLVRGPDQEHFLSVVGKAWETVVTEGMVEQDYCAKCYVREAERAKNRYECNYCFGRYTCTP